MPDADSAIARLEELESAFKHGPTVDILATGDLSLLILALEEKGPYTGQNTNTLLTIYDVFQGKKGSEQESLWYGIKAFAALRQKPEQFPPAMLKLKHPNTLLEYAAIVASDDELLSLLQAFRSEFSEHSVTYMRDLYGSKLKARDGEKAKALAKQLIVLARHVVDRTGEETRNELLRKLISKELESGVLHKIIDRRVEAYVAMARAYQELGNARGAVSALLEYDEYAGKAEVKGLSDEIKEYYFSRKLGLQTLSTGEVPEHLKVHPGDLAFGADEFTLFRLGQFGFKTGEAGPVKEEKPTDYRDEDFATVGVTRAADWKTARKMYIQRVKGESAVFNNPLAPSADVARVARLTTAWDNIKGYFLQKEAENMRAEKQQQS